MPQYESPLCWTSRLTHRSRTESSRPTRTGSGCIGERLRPPTGGGGATPDAAVHRADGSGPEQVGPAAEGAGRRQPLDRGSVAREQRTPGRRAFGLELEADQLGFLAVGLGEPALALDLHPACHELALQPFRLRSDRAQLALGILHPLVRLVEQG